MFRSGFWYSAGHFDLEQVAHRAAVVRMMICCGAKLLVLLTVVVGLVWQRILTPELCPDDVFHETFATLASQRGSR